MDYYLYNTKKFVDNNKLWFLIGYLGLFAGLFFTPAIHFPYGTAPAFTSYFTLLANIFNYSYFVYHGTNGVHFILINLLNWLAVALSIAIPILIYVAKKRLILLSPLSLIYFSQLMIRWYIIGESMSPHVAFYVFLLLTILEVTYYILTAYYKKHPAPEKPTKTIKPKAPTKDQRIAELEQRLADVESRVAGNTENCMTGNDAASGTENDFADNCKDDDDGGG